MILVKNSGGQVSVAVMGEINPYDEESIAQIREDGNVQDVVLDVASGGGDVQTALAFRAELVKKSENGTPVTIHARGVVASAACVLCSIPGAKVIAHAGAQFMMHPVSGVSIGDANAMEKSANAMRAIDESLKDIYAARLTGISREELDAMYNAETWLSPERAKEVGLVDELADDYINARNAMEEEIEKRTEDGIRCYQNSVVQRVADVQNNAIASMTNQVTELKNQLKVCLDAFESFKSHLPVLIQDAQKDANAASVQKQDEILAAVKANQANNSELIKQVSTLAGDMGLSEVCNDTNRKPFKLSRREVM